MELEARELLSRLFKEFLKNWDAAEEGNVGASKPLKRSAKALRATLAPVANMKFEAAKEAIPGKLTAYSDVEDSIRNQSLSTGSSDRSGGGGETDDPDKKDTSDLQSFLTGVSESLVETQKKLNNDSIEYVNELSELPHLIPPTYFTIPALKAELKLGFRKSSEKGLNVVLFSRKQQKEQYGESTVTFDMVAAPPPPGALSPALVPSLFIVGERKKRILDLAMQLAKEHGKKLREGYENTRDRALVLRRSPTEHNPVRFVVFWPLHRSGADDRRWVELSVFPLTGSDDDLQLAKAGVFFRDRRFISIEPANKLLGISGTKADQRNGKLSALDRADLQARALAAADSAAGVADAVNGISLFVREWLGEEPGGPPPKPGTR